MVALITVLGGLTGVRNNYNNQRDTPLYRVSLVPPVSLGLSVQRHDVWTDFSVSHTVLVQPRTDTSDRRQTEGGGQGAHMRMRYYSASSVVSFATSEARHGRYPPPLPPPLMPSGTDRAKNLMRLIATYFRSGEIEVVVFVVVVVVVFVVDSRPTATATR